MPSLPDEPFAHLFANWDERVEGRRVNGRTTHHEPPPPSEEPSPWGPRDDALVFCALVLMDYWLPFSDYPTEQIERMRARMREIALLFNPRNHR